MNGQGTQIKLSLLLGVVIAALTWPLWTGQGMLYFRDPFSTHVPAKRVTAELLRAGEDLWINPRVGLGRPLAANPNLQTFYPDTLLYLFLPFYWAWNVHVLGHLALAMGGVWRLIRDEGHPAPAALFGSLCLGLSGALLSYASFYNSLVACAWMPWMLFTARRLWTAGSAAARWRRVAWFAFTVAGEILAGEPVLAAIALVLVFLDAAVALVTNATTAHPELVEGRTADTPFDKLRASGAVRRVGSFSKTPLALFAGTGLGVAIALPAIAAAAGILPITVRGARGYSYLSATLASLSPWRFFECVVPFYFGAPHRLDAWGFWGAQHFQGWPPYIWSFYLGVPLCWLLLAIPLRGSPASKFYLAILWISLALSLGIHNPGYRWLYDHIPGFSLARYPSKWMFAATFMLALLGANKLGRLATESASRRRAALASVLLGAAIVAAPLAIGWLSPPDEFFRTAATIRAWVAAGAGLALVAAVHWLARRPAATQRTAGVFVLQLAALGIAAPPLLDTLPVAAVAVPPRLVELMPELKQGRIFHHFKNQLEPPNEDGTPRSRMMRDNALYHYQLLWPESAAAHGITYALSPDPDGMESVFTTLHSESLLALPCGLRIAELRAAGVRWLITDEPCRAPGLSLHATVRFGQSKSPVALIYEIADPLSAVTFLNRAEHAEGPQEFARRLRDPAFDPRQALVWPAPAEYHPPAVARWRITHDTSSNLRLRIEAQGEGFLLFDRTWYPPWKAQIDGRPVVLHPANLIGMALRVPSGTHTVDIGYQGPAAWNWWLALAALGAIVVFILAPSADRMRGP